MVRFLAQAVLPITLVLPAVRVAGSGDKNLLAETTDRTRTVSVMPPSSGPASASRPASFERAMVILIKDEITDVTKESIRRRLEKAKSDKTPLVVIELDTPGGALGATLDICDMIKELRDEGVSVYAWINKQAYSAGTIIALATDGIVMARNATMGDCQPILVTGLEVGAVPEDINAKLTSPLLAELRDSARRNGYNLNMVFSLIRPEMQMFWVENVETGERRFVETHERDILFQLPEAEEPQTGAKSSDDKSSAKDRGRRAEPVPDTKSKTAWRYVKKAPGMNEVPQPIDRADKELLTMKTVEAVAYGFCLGTVDGDKDLRTFFNITGSIEKTKNTWFETIVEWLASPMVRGVLFLLMVLGAYAEFQHPGFGLPGTVALIALVLFLGAPYMAGFTVTWEILAVVAGIILIAVELFVLPGFGVAGIAGILLVFIGALASFVPPEPGIPDWKPAWPSLPLSYTYLRNGLLAMAGSLVGSVIGVILIAYYLPKAPVVRALVSENPTHDQVTMDDPYVGVAAVGDIGLVEGILRPAGKARFGDVLVDVVSEGEYIRAGTHVRVVERSGNRIVVRRES